MKIGIEAQRIFRTKKHGMDFMALHLIRELQKLDKENEYFIFVNEGEDRDCLQEKENFKIVTFGGSYPVWEQLKLPQQARHYGIDLLHCTSNTAPLKSSMPTIVTIHDIIFLDKFPLTAKGYNWYQKLGNFYRRIVVGHLLTKLKFIYTVSHFEKQHIENKVNPTQAEVKVIYNGVGEHFKQVENQDILRNIRDKYQLPERFALFLGNTDPKKNTRNTVIAFAKYYQEYEKDCRLVIVDLESTVVERYLAQAGLRDCLSAFVFPGYVPNEEMPALHTLAQLFLYTSLRESFGIPILEAMACGNPVITSNTSSMPEVAGQAATLIDPTSIDEIQMAITQKLQNSEHRASKTKQGLERAAQFTWANTALAYKKEYENLIAAL